MSSPVGSSPEDDELQFTSVEPAATGPVAEASGVCVGCGQPIVSQYFALGDKMLCPACCAKVQAPPAGSRMGRFLKATMLGLVAGLLGALIWYVIRRVSHFEIGLVAVLVGFMVGKAVRAGSGGRGGRRYQVLAVVLTYCCIAANYMPDVLSAFMDVAREKHWTDASTQPSDDAAATAAPTTASADGSSGVAATQATAGGQRSDHHEKPSIGKMVLAVVVLIVLVFGVALAAPFMAGAQNLIGLLIIGFALWEAWKFNRRRVLPITGPYDFAGGTS